ncbi:MAG: sigma-54 dependent transcriptional regulator [Desulfobulbaceae bacterium]|jgi:two-component system NtrC family response regulator|nr:sigma-54 dependent transcriptional regulator [Desulfobulbaceae bacterium]
MTVDKYAVLVIDDEEPIRRLLQKELANPLRTIATAATAAEAMALTRTKRFDVVILDLWLPDVTNLDLLIRLRESIPHIEVVMITGHGDIDMAVEAMKLGACDFIRKPFNLDRLDLVVEKAHQRARLSRENAVLRHSADQKQNKSHFIGNSQDIREIRFLIEKVAPAKIPVLITGESGTGKDVVARMVHHLSPLAANQMIVKNCATLQNELARGELFGHVKGAFTGADESREGLLSFAHDSSLFFDEIGELPLEIQAALLRALETGCYRRVGEKEERRVNIRFLFATNRVLREEVEKGRFNEAFFHRINAFTIKIPPLRQRKEDLPLLVDYFLTSLSADGAKFRITDRAMERILGYDWPGNIRELRNVLERAIILAENATITETCLPVNMADAANHGANGDNLTLEGIERRHILKLLRFHDGNRQKTAESLGISRKTLYRKLVQYELDKS